MNRKERRTNKSRGGPQTDHPLNGLYQEAVEYHKAGKLAEAEQRYRQLLGFDPEHAQTLHMMGLLAYDINRNDIAEELVRKALALQNKDFVFHLTLGNILRKTGRFEEAITSYKRTIALAPEFAGALNNIGFTFMSLKKPEEAMTYFRRSQAIDPDLAETWNAIGMAFLMQGKPAEARDFYKRAIAIDPNLIEAINNLALNYLEAGEFQEAIALYKQSLILNPNALDVLINVGRAHKDSGHLDEAIVYFKRALVLNPTIHGYGGLLMAMIYAASVTPEDINKTAREFGEKIADPLLRPRPLLNNRDPERKLKVGYVSPDFKWHPVNYFFEPVLNAHDRQNFEIFAYSNNPGDDHITARLKGEFDHWRDIKDLNDDEAADLIEKDGIDILVDLAGHTAYTRLLVFARKPAPVQVTWLGYPASTGMKAMDYRITDQYAEPEGMTEYLNTETLWRMSEIFCAYQAHENSPDVIDHPPSDDNGFITFGCFNNFVKVTDPTLQVWAKILEQVPNSRLLLEINKIENAQFKADTESRLQRLGLPLDRVILEPRKPSNQFTLYNKIDIALDPLPCVGGTTSMDTMWMGVPLITLAGRHFTSRMGVSILTNADLPELITQNTDEYVKLATELALDKDRLRNIRHNLRERVAASPLMDQKGFTKNMEAAYREMWRKWCTKS